MGQKANNVICKDKIDIFCLVLQGFRCNAIVFKIQEKCHKVSGAKKIWEKMQYNSFENNTNKCIKEENNLQRRISVRLFSHQIEFRITTFLVFSFHSYSDSFLKALYRRLLCIAYSFICTRIIIVERVYES